MVDAATLSFSVSGGERTSTRLEDWACDDTWCPPDRYLRLSELASFGSKEWPAALEHVVDLVKEVAPWNSAPSTVLGVGVGFDGGDVNVVWMRQ